MSEHPAVPRRLVALVLALVVAGCGGGAPSRGQPSTSLGVGESPAPSLDLDAVAVCDATVMMERGVAHVDDVKLRAGARNRLFQAVQSVLTGQDALMSRAPLRMATRIRTLNLAVTNLVLANEDFATTDQISEAAGNVRKANAQLAKAIDAFQKWLGCDELPQPTEPPPSPSPSPGASDVFSPGPSIQG